MVHWVFSMITTVADFYCVLRGSRLSISYPFSHWLLSVPLGGLVSRGLSPESGSH